MVMVLILMYLSSYFLIEQSASYLVEKFLITFFMALFPFLLLSTPPPFLIFLLAYWQIAYQCLLLCLMSFFPVKFSLHACCLQKD